MARAKTPVEPTSLIDQIGQTAGEVWKALQKHGTLTMTQLAKEVDAPRDRVMQAVGWLAREGKVQMSETARRKSISLS